MSSQPVQEADDEIIGRAVKGSAIAVVLGGVVLGTFLWLKSGTEVPDEVVLEKDAGEISALDVQESVLPVVGFTDITAAAGIDFVHENGATDAKYLPETMGGGAAFFDADGDGDEDLYFVNGKGWEAGAGPGNRLYLNDGAGMFADATEAWNAASSGYGMGVAVGDVDGDGRLDLFTTGIGGNRLLMNTGGRFEDTTEASGLRGAPEAWTTSAGFFDMENDGDLDLFVCQYVRWSPSIDDEVAYSLNGVDRAYGPPMNYGGTFSSLYRNRGDGTFEDVSVSAGIQIANASTGAPEGKALGVSFLDLDSDGMIDIAVANDTVQNHLFRNLGDGRFEEVGARVGFGFDRNGAATGAMGIDATEFRGPGSLAIGIGNFAGEMTSLYVRNERRMRFSDDSMGEGIGSPSRRRLSFGLTFLDYDLDGREDLLQVNGHLDPTIHEVQPSQTYLQAPQLFWNQGESARACFALVPIGTTGDLARELAGRGSAQADIDGDGDLDLVIVQVGKGPVLLRNDQDTGHRWLRVRLSQSGANREALGASVTLLTDGAPLTRRVSRTRSYLSQSEATVTFGLGKGVQPAGFEVRWPDGETQSFGAPGGVNSVVTLVRTP